MKTLILLRHAKSDWSGWKNSGGLLTDIERPLSEKGRNACRKIAKLFLSMHLKVDRADYSTAKRASETFDLIQSSFQFVVQK